MVDKANNAGARKTVTTVTGNFSGLDGGHDEGNTRTAQRKTVTSSGFGLDGDSNRRKSHFHKMGSGTNNSEITFSQLVHLFHDLMDAHETRLCIDLLSGLRGGALGATKLPISCSRLFNELESLAKSNDKERGVRKLSEVCNNLGKTQPNSTGLDSKPKGAKSAALNLGRPTSRKSTASTKSNENTKSGTEGLISFGGHESISFSQSLKEMKQKAADKKSKVLPVSGTSNDNRNSELELRTSDYDRLKVIEGNDDPVDRGQTSQSDGKSPSNIVTLDKDQESPDHSPKARSEGQDARPQENGVGTNKTSLAIADVLSDFNTDSSMQRDTVSTENTEKMPIAGDLTGDAPEDTVNSVSQIGFASVGEPGSELTSTEVKRITMCPKVRSSDISGELDSQPQTQPVETKPKMVAIKSSTVESLESEDYEGEYEDGIGELPDFDGGFQEMDSEVSDASSAGWGNKKRKEMSEYSDWMDDAEEEEEQLRRFQGLALGENSTGLNEAGTQEMGDDDRQKRRNHNKLIVEENAPWLAEATGAWVIHPNTPWRMIWDLFCLVVISVECVIIPLSVSFDVKVDELWSIFVLIFFCLDICLSFNTGYFTEGMLVLRQDLIVKRYFTGFFFIDFISTFPWEYALNADRATQSASVVKAARFTKLFRLARLLRLLKLRGVMARLEDLLPSTELVHLLVTGLGLLKMMGMFTVVLHWSACAWGWIGSPDKVGHETAELPPHDIEECAMGGACERGLQGSPWLRRYGLDNNESHEQYLASLLFTTGLVTGGEWGVYPGRWPERLYTILMMIISFLLCSTIMSQIVLMMQKIQADSIEFRENLKNTVEFMTSRKVPLPLQGKIKRYLKFQHKIKKNSSYERAMMIEQLSPWLRLELTEHLNSEVIRRHPFFANLPPQVFKRVCEIAEVVLFAQGDVVVQRGHAASCMCFIVSGKIQILKRASQKKASQDAGGGGGPSPMMQRSATIAQLAPQGNGANLEKSLDNQKGPQNSDESPILESPSWIGDLCLFKEMVRSNTIVSLTHTELLMLKKDGVLDVLDEYPKTRTLFNEWVEWAAEVEEGGVKCEHCGMPGHTVRNCPTITDHLAHLHSPGQMLGRASQRIRSSMAQTTQSGLNRMKSVVMRNTTVGGNRNTTKLQRTYTKSGNRGAILFDNAGPPANAPPANHAANGDAGKDDGEESA